jgi:predicted nucleic acid-binding protein
MKKRTVYIETSIVSYLTGKPSRDLLIAACQQATHVWWDEHRLEYDLYISQLVVAEASRGDTDTANSRLHYLAGIPELRITPEVSDLAKGMIRKGVLPAKAEADALHIAIAAIHRTDLLLTWNCRHIDNPVTKPMVRALCIAAGFSCPEICTPMEILEMMSDEE